jgi:hypothetical protein
VSFRAPMPARHPVVNEGPQAVASRHAYFSHSWRLELQACGFLTYRKCGDNRWCFKVTKSWGNLLYSNG